MDWSSSHKIKIIASISAIAFVIVAIFVYVKFIKHEPTCFDQKQNQDERGIDCGGICSIMCLADTKPLIPLWTRPIKITGDVFSVVSYIENQVEEKLAGRCGRETPWHVATADEDIQVSVLVHVGEGDGSGNRAFGFEATDRGALGEIDQADRVRLGRIRRRFEGVGRIRQEQDVRGGSMPRNEPEGVLGFGGWPDGDVGDRDEVVSLDVAKEAKRLAGSTTDGQVVPTVPVPIQPCDARTELVEGAGEEGLWVEVGRSGIDVAMRDTGRNIGKQGRGRDGSGGGGRLF